MFLCSQVKDYNVPVRKFWLKIDYETLKIYSALTS